MYVFQIPFEQQKELCAILDVGNGWENLAGKMGFSADEVATFRSLVSRGDSPTAELLRVWGSRGYRVDKLYDLLFSIQNRRAMQTIAAFVDQSHMDRLEKRTAERNRNFSTEAAPSGSQSRPTNVQWSNFQLSRTDGDNAEKSPEFISKFSPSRQQSQTTSSIATGYDVSIAAGLQTTLAIAYEELAEATDNFSASNILGRGGYGVVFRGFWKHTAVAVKQIGGGHQKKPSTSNNANAEKERLKQSLMELKTLALYRHDNILPLYGYSLNGPEPCLVYQLMVGGSLEDKLLCRGGTAPLDWCTRHAIVVGSVRGLNFLHTCAKEPLIHGDIKSANILLDAHLEPKIGDFGLSRRGVMEVPGNQPLIASHIKGTLAYLPPEFLRSKHLSTKLDVYSFGVVLFEIASGLRAYSDSRKPENLVDFIKSKHREPSFAIVAIADKRGVDENMEKLVPALIDEGLKCTSVDVSLRPTMRDVLETFELIEF